MEQYTPAFPIEVVFSPKAIPCFLDFGFHEVERHDSGGAVRLHKPDGCEGDLDRIVALAQAGVALLADVEGDFLIVDGHMLAAKAGNLVELDPSLIGNCSRAGVSFSERTVDRNSVACYWGKRGKGGKGGKGGKRGQPELRPSRASALSHSNISPFSLENKRPPSNHPFSPFYNGAGMKLSTIQPPPHSGAENQKIPSEPIFAPNPNQTQPLAPYAHEAACAVPPLAGIVEVDTPRTMQSPVLSREEELYWLALKLVPGLGSRTSNKLLDRFRTPQAIFRASRTELEGAGVSGAIAQSIASGCTFDDAATQQEKMAQFATVAVTIGDPRYPPMLREIFDPPVLLFARGRIELLQTICLGVVGTRRPTPYGLAVAERLSGDLAHAGLTISSGMARGIDTAAHKGALARGGNTIAVLGCGVDVVYPSENRRLAAELVAKGLIISEFPMGAVAFPQNFPIRNRIISGISVGVLVVEGAQYSGSAITAKLAMDQGREVFAVPGNITSKLSWGPNLLIKQGARLIQDWNDVVAELPPESRRQLIDKGRKQLLGGEDATSGAVQASLLGEQAPELGDAARRALAALQVDAAIHLDDLLEKVEDTSPSELIAALFELEMLGLVKQLPGKNFVKVW